MQRQQLEDLEELTEQKKRQAVIDLEQEQAQEVERKRAEIQKKYMTAADDENLTGELKKLMGDESAKAD